MKVFDGTNLLEVEPGGDPPGSVVVDAEVRAWRGSEGWEHVLSLDVSTGDAGDSWLGIKINDFPGAMRSGGGTCTVELEGDWHLLLGAIKASEALDVLGDGADGEADGLVVRVAPQGPRTAPPTLAEGGGS